MGNLVTNHIYAVLAIAGLVSMILTGCAIQAGDVLYKRFQRKALDERSLNKVKLVAVILVSISLLTSQLVFAEPPPKRLGNYQTLFLLVDNILTQTRNVCKTEACAKAVGDLTAVMTDGKDKHKRGILVEETRGQFHREFKTAMTNLRTALTANLSEEDKDAAMRKLPECPSCDKAPPLHPAQYGTQAQCTQCYEVLHSAVEICALYTGICPTCLIICMATAALGFGGCIRAFCPPDNPPGGFNDN